MKVNDFFVLSVKGVARMLNKMTADLTPDQLHWDPPGTAHSVAASLAHSALATDWQIQGLFQGGTPWFASDWAGKTGVSEPTPAQTLEWAQSVEVDLPVLQKYAAAVYANAAEYIAGLSEDDLNREIDLSIIGSGPMPLSWCLTILVDAHLNQLAGEISAVKGMQGQDGYVY